MDDEEQKNSNFDKFKQFVKLLIRKRFTKRLIIVLVIVMIIVIICASSWFLRLIDALFPGDADEPNYSEYCPLEYFNNIYIADNGTLMAGTSVQDIWDHDKRYSRYLSNVDALAYLLNAQVASQYPYIESAKNEQLNGTIKFYRNNSQIPMTYVSQDTFDGYVSSFNNNGNQDAKNKALQSFAINSDGTIKVAYQKGESEELISNYEEAANQAAYDLGAKATVDKNSSGEDVYVVSTNNSNMYTKNISYRDIIQNYSLPFELLWAMVVMADNGSSGAGNSEDFAHAVASMAYDGQIALVIDDNTSTTQTVETESYDVVTYNSYVQISLKVNGFHRQAGTDVNMPVNKDSYHSAYTKIETTGEPVLRIKKIESWSAVYEGRDSFDTTKTNAPAQVDDSESSDSKFTVHESKEFSVSYGDCDKDSIKNQFTIDENDGNEYWLDYKEQTRSRKENISHITTASTSRTSYSNSTSVTPNYNDDITDLFNVTPFTTVKRYLTKTNYKTFIDVIEKNSTTSNMVDLINYIFNQVTGTTKYGEDLEWESVWKSAGFTDASGGKVIAADTIQAKVWFSLKEEGYSDVAAAAVMGNIEGESSFNPGIVEGGSGIGFGLCQWSFDRRTALENFARKRGVDPSDEDLQIEFLIAELTPGGGAEGYATYQFSGFDSYKNTWVTTSDVAEATTAFCAGFERPGVPRNEARIAAAKKYYDQFQGAKLSSLSSGNGSIESSNTLGIKGYYTAKVSGRKFTLYCQNIQGSAWYWDSGCFVTSQATIASGFGSKLTPNQFTGFMGLGYVSDFQTKCGCKYSREHSMSANTMKQYLQDGKAIMIELIGKTLKTDNGSAYYSQHYVSVIDYKNDNGVDKVYIHDPWDGSGAEGWANINDIVSVSTCFDSVWK